MKRIFGLVILALWLPTSACIAAASGGDVNLMTEDFPPFQMKQGDQLTGISIDIVRLIEQKLNRPDKVKMFPWSRGLKILQHKPNTALFSMVRTPEREPKYKWVGPLHKIQLVFFKKKGVPLTIHSLDDAKKVNRIGVIKDVANHEFLRSHGFTNLDIIKSGSDDKNIRKLAKGRIDLWPSLRTAGLFSAKQMHLADQIEPIDNLVLFSGDLYIAFSKTTDDKTIHAWQQALDQIRASGAIDKIVAKYLH